MTSNGSVVEIVSVPDHCLSFYSAFKCACDCYLLNMFINGDTTFDIRELFVSSAVNERIIIGAPKVAEQEHQTVKDKLNISSMMAMITLLQKDLQEIKQKQHENALLMNNMKIDIGSTYRNL